MYRKKRGDKLQIIISNSLDKPIYEQISEAIKVAILSGELVGGEALPSIRSLAKDLRISNITTKKAYEELEKDGFIMAVPSKGYFVKQKSDGYLKEEILTKIEENLQAAINVASTYQIKKEEVFDILKTLYMEDEDEKRN